MCNAAVSSCEEGAQWSKALLLLEDLSNDRRMGMSCDIITFNSAISACEKSSQWRWALEVLMQADETLHLDVISFSASISACEKAGKWQHALNLYSEFLLRALQMDLIIYNAMISACEKGGQWQAALHFMGHLVSNGLKPDQTSHNALLSAFQKGQQWQKALHTFQELRSAGTTNLISYNSVMRACIDHWTLALQLFTDLKKEGHDFCGDLVTYSSLISACEKGQQWCLALCIFEDSQRQEVLFDSILYMATISAVKSKWRIVLDLLAELRMRHFSIDTDAYDVILSSCELAGGVSSKNASTFLRELQDEAIRLLFQQPNSQMFQGVTHLALLSRSGKCQDEQAANKLQQLCSDEIKVLTEACDISSQDAVQKAASIMAMDELPVKGVIHAAGLLEDHLIAHMDGSRHLLPVLAPKMDGAVNLHAIFGAMRLDHFMLFSSVAALLGSPGQGNYAAANSFLDSFALHRQARGLTALSLQWGPWAEVGMAAMRGVGGPGFWAPKITAMDALQALGSVLTSRSPAVISITQVNWSILLKRMSALPP
eukprot:symbB.v1.2.040348.t1/scaffold7162.1/size12977/1